MRSGSRHAALRRRRRRPSIGLGVGRRRPPAARPVSTCSPRPRAPRSPCRRRWRAPRAPSSWPRAPPGAGRPATASPGRHRHPHHRRRAAGPGPTGGQLVGRPAGTGPSSTRAEGRRARRRRPSARPARPGSAGSPRPTVRTTASGAGRQADSTVDRARRRRSTLGHGPVRGRTGSRPRSTLVAAVEGAPPGAADGVVAPPRRHGGRAPPAPAPSSRPGRPGRRPRRGGAPPPASASGAASTVEVVAVEEAGVGVAGQERGVAQDAHQQVAVGGDPVDLGPGQRAGQGARPPRCGWGRGRSPWPAWGRSGG